MAWVVVNRDGTEVIFENKPKRMRYYWFDLDDEICLPEGSIEKLTGEPMSWEDSPREVK